ncbi:cupin domain-containing protein [Pelagicoccus albus]|uniref:Cupin domain-containing protein n=1 Tax=Pelagicoccus albus TaxID=415222 RepID=A0A7X1B6T8_9BACT|nr:cupin domain-containing protein [Pelagicoccus albus]MBC2606758.1 cupin domain-containing protein [Pelagicoccus albus]
MDSSNKVIVEKSTSFPLEVVAAGEGTSRSVLIGPTDAPNFALRKFVMEPGGGMPAHTNTVEHEQYILKGGAEVGIGEKVFSVREGDVVFIPAGVPHWYKADAQTGFEFLCIVPNKDDRIELVDTGC